MCSDQRGRWPARLAAILALVCFVGCSPGTSQVTPAEQAGGSAAPLTVPASGLTTTGSGLPEDACHGDTLQVAACLSGVRDSLDSQRTELSSRLQSTMLPTTISPPSGFPTNLGAEWSKSETAFEAYRKQTCDTVYLMNIDGSLRNYYALQCDIRLTRERIEFLAEQASHS